MSGSSHNEERSKFSALLVHLQQVGRDAQKQRGIAAAQRDRAGKAQIAARASTQSDTLRARATTENRRSIEGVAAPAVVAFAVSAGGLAPLIAVLAALPRDLRAAVLVALHAGDGNTLPALLQMRCLLHVKFAESGEVIQSGTVYVAPPLLHLIVNANRTCSVVDKGRLQFARPSADWLFETIAGSYAECAIAIVLSGYQRDGARGIIRIRQSGGVTIAQDPDTCRVNDMPNAAIRTGSVSRVLRPELIAGAIMDSLQTMDLERIGPEFDNPFAAA